MFITHLFFQSLLKWTSGTFSNTKIDLLIENAVVADESGGDLFETDILIDNGVIAGVREPGTADEGAVQVIDAAGRIASPGFIDTHSHGNPLDTPRFDNFLSMGVTTMSLGLDGRSPGGEHVAAARGYGSFAKIIRQYVNEEQLLTLEEAIHKMSGLPAATLGLDDPERVDTPRGLIREGFAAVIYF